MTRPDGGRLAAAVGLVSYATSAVLVVVALVRAVGPFGSPLLVGLQAAVPYVLLGAYPLTMVGALRAQRVLTAIGITLMVAHVAWTVPEVARGRGVEVPPSASWVRLVTANIYAGNPSVDELVAELAATDADVVLLQELTPALLDAIEGTGLTQQYPHQVLDPRDGAHGSGILSRLPMTEGRSFPVAGWPMTTALLTVDAVELRVVNVHVAAPLSGTNVPTWEGQLDQLAAASRLGGDRVLLAGDFNATLQHEPLRGILDAGYREAFNEAGRGLGATWPTDRLLPPLIRIDHVFVGPGLGVAHIELGDGPGSDHRPVIVDLVVE